MISAIQNEHNGPNRALKSGEFSKISGNFQKFFSFQSKIGSENGNMILKSGGIDSSRPVDGPRYQEH